MSLKLYNTLTNKKEIFEPIEQGKVGMYVCGVTVYDNCHLGHARAYVAFDILVRYFRYQGYKINYVRNITDIEDKIIERANENSESIYDLTSRTIASMHADFQGLGLIEPNSEPKATEYIDGMVTMIEDLITKGHAYVADNNDVFFSVRSYEEYGKLSNKVLDDLDPGSRISEDQAKADPLDFVLWKSAKPEEPSWDSPWGKGRPGWHIECSVMSLEKLGKNFDIHGGGPDLIFPHHENEIAQSKCSNDSEFANYWIHSGLLKIGGEKMSKSLGNFALIKDLIKQYHFEVIRLFLISSHYRSELSFDDGSLNQARAALERLYTTLQLNDEDAENTAKENPFIEAFEMAMNDDLNTPKAVSILFDLAKELNSNKDKNSRNEQLYAFKTIANNLGLLTDKPENFFKFGAEVDDLFIQEKIDARNLARNQKDFVRADEIRDELSDMGVLLDDGPDGTTWKIEKPN